MLADARKVREELAASILQAGGYRGDLFVMGRSMGRHAAFELAANSPDGALKGVIIESGRPILGNFCYGVDPAALPKGWRRGTGPRLRPSSLPALVIHGELDTLAPVGQAREMYESFSSERKQILTIPGAGHNDLLYRGINEYFTAIREFVGA